jgi:hypothetical protein
MELRTKYSIQIFKTFCKEVLAMSEDKGDKFNSEVEKKLAASKSQSDFDWGTKGQYKTEQYVTGRNKDAGKFAFWSNGKYLVYGSMEDLKQAIDGQQ